MNCRQFLLDEFYRRQKKNRAYSMRAFSRDLGIHSSRLSEILSGKIGLSVTKALLIAKKMELDEQETIFLVDLVESEHSRNVLVREAAKTRVKARLMNTKKLSEEQFNLISQWQYMAILELLNLQDIEHSVKSFAARLNISEDLVTESIENLTKLNMLAREGDKWIACEEDSVTSEDVPSEYIKNYQVQILEKAQDALWTQDVLDRDITSMVFAMNPQQMNHAKERLREFRRTLVKELEAMGGKEAVYCLSLQLFSLTEKK